MLIYQLVFGTDSGQVNCVFHNDSVASSGIGPNGEFNCFTCGAKAHNSAGFIAKYFNVSIKKAERIHATFERLQNYKYTKLDLTDEQIKYLKSIGLSQKVIDKYFFRSGRGKLIYNHLWNGISVGYTWFNAQVLSNYNASAKKYKYDKNIIGGMVSPYDKAIKYKTLLITEGEKDMLTALSMGIPNAVAKIGGVKSRIIGGLNFQNKNIILCYDCDKYGREGAKADAKYLIEKFNCKVKIVDLGLNNGEDLNDYFTKYKSTLNDFEILVKATPTYTIPPEEKQTKVEKILASLTSEEIKELTTKIKEGEKENG